MYAVLDQAVERSTVRSFLSHDPDSRTFEKHYNNSTLNVDVSAIIHGEKQRSLEDNAHPVLYRIQYSWTPEEENDIDFEDTYNDVGDALGIKFGDEEDEENEAAEPEPKASVQVQTPTTLVSLLSRHNVLSASVNIDEAPSEKVAEHSFASTPRVFPKRLLDTEKESHAVEIGSMSSYDVCVNRRTFSNATE